MTACGAWVEGEKTERVDESAPLGQLRNKDIPSKLHDNP